VSAAANPAMAAGATIRQSRCTRWVYWAAAKPVPQTEAALLVPNSVAGCAPGNVANSAGTIIRPPPPTIESIKPAIKEASAVRRNSIAELSHSPWECCRQKKAPCSTVLFVCHLKWHCCCFMLCAAARAPRLFAQVPVWEPHFVRHQTESVQCTSNQSLRHWDLPFADEHSAAITGTYFAPVQSTAQRVLQSSASVRWCCHS